MSRFSSKALKALYALKKIPPPRWQMLFQNPVGQTWPHSRSPFRPVLLEAELRERTEGSLRADFQVLGAIARALPGHATLKMTKSGNYFYTF